MAFDQNDPRPNTVNLHKRTTQVNIWMIVGVILFLIGTILVAVKMWKSQ